MPQKVDVEREEAPCRREKVGTLDATDVLKDLRDFPCGVIRLHQLNFFGFFLGFVEHGVPPAWLRNWSFCLCRLPPGPASVRRYCTGGFPPRSFSRGPGFPNAISSRTKAMPVAIKAFFSSVPNPSNSLNTISVCSPAAGGKVCE